MDCVRFGAGSRTMVLIPGLRLRPIREMAYAMGRMYRRFAAEYTVYILDRLDPAPAGYTVRAMAADTAEAMDSLGLAGADVLGVSQGGMIALDLALDRPELVGKLALAVTAARPNDALRQAVGRWEALAKAGDYGGGRDGADVLGGVSAPFWPTAAPGVPGGGQGGPGAVRRAHPRLPHLRRL